MSYIIRGLDPAPFNALADAGESALAEAHAIHVTADTATGYPCRVTLADAPEGTAMLLLPFTSHDAPTPYHTRYAIYVTEGATEAAQYDGQVPHMMARRTVALRGFDKDGMLKSATLNRPEDDLDGAIRAMLEDEDIPTVQIYCCAYGCFLGTAERM